jgi:hypothetical protein
MIGVARVFEKTIICFFRFGRYLSPEISFWQLDHKNFMLFLMKCSHFFLVKLPVRPHILQTCVGIAYAEQSAFLAER